MPPPETHIRAPKKSLGVQFSVPVRACHLAEDGRALVATLTQGYFLRYELDLLRPARDKGSFEDASEDESDDQVGGQYPVVILLGCSTPLPELPELVEVQLWGLDQAGSCMGSSCLRMIAFRHGRW